MVKYMNKPLYEYLLTLWCFLFLCPPPPPLLGLLCPCSPAEGPLSALLWLLVALPPGPAFRGPPPLLAVRLPLAMAKY